MLWAIFGTQTFGLLGSSPPPPHCPPLQQNSAPPPLITASNRSPYPQFGVPPGQPSPVAKAPLAESVADLDTVALAYDLTSGIIGHAVKALLRVHKFVRLASALSEPSSLIKAMTAEMLAEQERPLDEYLKATPPGPEKTVGQRHGRKATALNDRLRCALGLPTEPETPTRPPSSRLSPRPPKTVSPRPPALSVSPGRARVAATSAAVTRSGGHSGVHSRPATSVWQGNCFSVGIGPIPKATQ